MDDEADAEDEMEAEEDDEMGLHLELGDTQDMPSMGTLKKVTHYIGIYMYMYHRDFTRECRIHFKLALI